ncbi:hypothetical protein PIB30_078618 [Stylosanthes scabra]|uniref:Uncharacterized protein n=1 Tax=Stylosanthes scabra TaxID=79078 RepID=A0ABU6QQG3_9FABA|nr:hypothetical protein [Stylosanthes scabra]
MRHSPSVSQCRDPAALEKKPCPVLPSPPRHSSISVTHHFPATSSDPRWQPFLLDRLPTSLSSRAATAVSQSCSVSTASNRRLFASQLGGPCLAAAVCLESLCTTVRRSSLPRLPTSSSSRCNRRLPIALSSQRPATVPPSPLSLEVRASLPQCHHRLSRISLHVRPLKVPGHDH